MTSTSSTKKLDDSKQLDEFKQLIIDDKNFAIEVFCDYLQNVLESEMTEQIGAAKGERSTARKGYRSGYYRRSLVTRVGRLELRIPQDREGRFSTKLFARYQRSEKALLAALVEMYVSGVSTRKVRRITEDLCGHGFSASTISNLVKDLDAQLTAFSERALEQPFPYLILDARYERVREEGIVGKQALQIALGIDADGRRHVLGVDLADRESLNSWKDFLLGLCERGLKGVRYVESDDHAGLPRPGSIWRPGFSAGKRASRVWRTGLRRTLRRRSAFMALLCRIAGICIRPTCLSG